MSNAPHKLTLINFAERAAFVVCPVDENGVPHITARAACIAVGMDPDAFDAEQARMNGVRLGQIAVLNSRCPRPRHAAIYVRG